MKIRNRELCEKIGQLKTCLQFILQNPYNPLIANAFSALDKLRLGTRYCENT